MRIQTPVKVFIISLSTLVIIFIAGATYLSVAQNSVFESIYYFISGYTETEETVEQEISYGTQETNDDNLEEGASRTKQEGIVGKRRITYRVLRDKNGKEIKRTVISSEIVTTPTDKIIAKGTKKPEEPEPEESSDFSYDYTYDNGGGTYYGGGGQSYSGNTGSNSGGGSGQQSQPEPQPEPQQPTAPSVHYCTNSYQQSVSGGVYVKTPYPCGQLPGKWGSYDTEISESEYYSYDTCWHGIGGVDEARCRP